MAHSTNGTGKFGVWVKYENGDTEMNWFEKESERNKTLARMNRASGIASIKKKKR